jgi:hypothetical protein
MGTVEIGDIYKNVPFAFRCLVREAAHPWSGWDNEPSDHALEEWRSLGHFEFWRPHTRVVCLVKLS